MDWNADAFFAIGKTHMVCEDYARAGFQENGVPFAVVCDGCSSSPDTDFGARLLAAAAAFEMHWCHRPTFNERNAFGNALDALRRIDLDPRALDATLIAAWWDSENPDVLSRDDMGIRVRTRGDGVVVGRLRDGGFQIHVVDYPHNAPRYLNYDFDASRLEGYLAKFGDAGRVRTYSSEIAEIDPPTRGWIAEYEGDFNGHPEDAFFPVSDFDLVMVLSDGVQTFQRVVETGTSRTLEDVPVEQVIEQLLLIKGTKGHFLQRRCHKFLTKFCEREQWQHADDFSAAAIWMDDPND